MAPRLNSHTGMILIASYLVLLLVNSLTVYLGSLIFTSFIVLGTHELTPLFAVLLSTGILSLICTFAIPFVRVYENYSHKMFTTPQWMGVYFTINFITIWLITRFAFQLGFGISSWMVALVLAVILDVLQGLAIKSLGKCPVLS